MNRKYRIFDTRKSIMSDYPVVEAESGREAIDKYLIDEDIEVKASGDDNVHFKTTPYKEKDGVKYKAGRATWWKIVS